MRIKKELFADLADFRRQKYWWLGYAGFAAAAFFVLFYADLQITSDHGMLFLDMLFRGDILQFYTDTGAAYLLPVYIIFAIWMLPAWLMCRLGLAVPAGIGCLLWSKGVPLLGGAACLWMFRKLLRAARAGDEEFWCFQMASSLLFFLPVCVTVQYDVLELFFGLLGIYMASREERLSWRTLLVLSLSISLKLLMVFPIVLLILLKEKRFLHIILDLCSLLSVSILSVLPYMGTFFTGTSNFSERMLDKLLAVTLPTGFVNVSVFFLLFLAICLAAYCTKTPTEQPAFFRVFCWFAVAYFFAFFLFAEMAHPHWVVLMAPFVILLLAQNPERLKLNLLLEVLLELCLILFHSWQSRWVYLTDTSFSYLLLKDVPSLHLHPQYSIEFFSQIINGLGLDTLLPAAGALLMVCAGGLLVLNHPFGRSLYTGGETAETLVSVKRNARVVRLVILGGYMAVAAAVALLL